MKSLIFAAILGLAPCVAAAQQAETALGGELRVLDKLNGTVQDIEFLNGETQQLDHLKITFEECRYPRSNPSGDSFANLTITYRDNAEPVFQGWLIASAPALNAMEHPRYDVWVLRCIRS
jgi:hypothetical protein